MNVGLKLGLVKFFQALKACGEIANNHPFCVEEDPNFNAIVCAVMLNKCILDETEGMWECMPDDFESLI